MFKLLSKESNIFSIPVYIGFLLLVVLAFNLLNFSYENAFTTIITFLGIALGYFVFNQINLNHKTHLALFLYTFFILAFYPEDLDVGIAVSLLTNSFILLILTNPDEQITNQCYLLIGSILVINYIFLPTTWPMFLFCIIHIIATSKNIGLNIFRLLLGIIIMFLAYFSLMFFFNYTSLNTEYFPKPSMKWNTNFYPLYYCIPIFLFFIYAIVDHFTHYNEKSPVSRYKYTFLLTFVFTQLTSIFLYMGTHFEYLLLLSLPASIILSRFLRFLPKYWLKELGLWIITICLIIYKISYISKLF